MQRFKTTHVISAAMLYLLFSAVPGCSSGDAVVAPRTEDEIAAYKSEVYAAEEEDDAAAEADE